MFCATPRHTACPLAAHPIVCGKPASPPIQAPHPPTHPPTHPGACGGRTATLVTMLTSQLPSGWLKDCPLLNVLCAAQQHTWHARELRARAVRQASPPLHSKQPISRCAWCSHRHGSDRADVPTVQRLVEGRRIPKQVLRRATTRMPCARAWCTPGCASLRSPLIP